jgi:BlaI family transcriptional regulator, penicillinase repressor
MAQVPAISSAEWEVMRVLWRGGPQNANDVADALPAALAWHPKTVRTLLDRLVRKKALSKNKRGGVYVYAPLVDEATALRAESRGFAERYFGGRLQPMIAHFITQEQLSKEEIAALRTLLDEKRDQ